MSHVATFTVMVAGLALAACTSSTPINRDGGADRPSSGSGGSGGSTAGQGGSGGATGQGGSGGSPTGQGGSGGATGQGGSGGVTGEGGAGGTAAGGTGGDVPDAGLPDGGGTDGPCTPDGGGDCCPNDPNKTAPGVCGCGTSDVDTDSDGTPDCNDTCPVDNPKTAPGVCGCSTPDTDSDNDTVPDCNDPCPKNMARTTPGPCGCLPDTLAVCLAHRYTFDGTGTVVTDSVAGAAGNGTAINATLSGTGTIVLAGGTTDQYVQLPAGIISALGPSATFEAWVTWNPVNTTPNTSGPWQRIFDFGNSDIANAQGTGQTYLFLTPSAGSSRLRAAITLASNAGEDLIDAPVALPTVAIMPMSFVAVVVDGTAKTLTLYLNGLLQGSIPIRDETKLTSLNDTNNWLGRSQWGADQEFAGTLHEFRIYSSARTAAQIMTSNTAGPGTPPAQ